MEQRILDLFFGSVLHDIGKPVQRATRERKTHSKIGKEFLEKFDFSKEILDQVRYHHAKDLIKARLEEDSLVYITYIADNISSGIDRRKSEEEIVGQRFKADIPLEDIFNRFKNESVPRYYRPGYLNVYKEPNYPEEKAIAFTDGDYSGVVSYLSSNLALINHTEEYVDSLLNLLEATLYYVPSSTNLEEVADISLYDHLKLTAAVACAIYQYLEANEITNYKQELFNCSDEFYEKKAFILASFDISGIQNFIYTIVGSGAHKHLRSRSFYLDMLSEWIVTVLLDELSLTRANLIYNGGGHAYFILANTERTRHILEKVEHEFNQFFLQTFGIKLYVAFGWSSFRAREVMIGNKVTDYSKIFQRISRQISDKKQSRYSTKDLMKLNEMGKRAGRECRVCHTIHNLKDNEDLCKICSLLESFSSDIQRADYFIVTNKKDGLPLGPGAFLSVIGKEAIIEQKFEGKIFAKNIQMTGIDQSVHVWVADYSSSKNNDFNEYVERAWATKENKTIGSKKIGVLRADVDDLGLGFMAGFSMQNQGRYNTLSRTATFSRNMALFFKVYVNQIAEDLHITLIYSGGDDLFAIGAWDDIISFAMELRDSFLYWTNDKLTLSAGIGMFDGKTPINIMARETGKLEQAAKDAGKNSICLFSDENVFPFDIFTDEIIDISYRIEDFFESQGEKGKAFIYKILSLIEDKKKKSRISFARLVYLLARIESEMTNRAIKAQNSFNDLKKLLIQSFNDHQDIQKTDMALRLYIYKNREEG